MNKPLGDGTVAIYALIDPRDKRVRYIGSTANPIARLSTHKSATTKSAKDAWIKELKAEGLTPDMRILEKVEPFRAHKSERKWMRLHLAEGCDLFNVNMPDPDSDDSPSFDEAIRFLSRIEMDYTPESLKASYAYEAGAVLEATSEFGKRLSVYSRFISQIKDMRVENDIEWLRHLTVLFLEGMLKSESWSRPGLGERVKHLADQRDEHET